MAICREFQQEVLEPMPPHERPYYRTMRRTTNQIKTEWLVLRCQAGEPEAFEELVRHWHRRLLGHVRRQTDGHEDTSDIMQDIWMTVARKLRRLKDPAGFPQWLYKIARAQCIDWIRKRQRDRKLQDAVAREEASNSAEPANDADRSDTKRMLRQAIRRLPAGQSTVLTMFYLDELTVAEISATVGIPEGTVKSRLYHARNHLRQLIERSQT
jgi:RNA polymerase sigma-70 factor (ECF subfamily)